MVKTERIPLISVVIPVYNTEKYMKSCLDSVRDQTYSNLEVILINDGSSDNSGNICREYVRRDSRFRVIHLEENRGVSHARNIGIENSRGRYLCFVDADDFVEKKMVERLYENLMEQQADVSICGVRFVGFGKYADSHRDGQACMVSGREAISCMICREPFGWTACGRLFQKDQIRRHLFSEDAYAGEDVLFMYRIFQYVSKVSYIPDKLYCYIHREDSAMHGDFNEKQYTESKVYEFLYQEVSQKYPQLQSRIRQKILAVNTKMAVRVAESGRIRGKERYGWLLRCRRKIRCYMNRESLALFEHKKIAAETVLLYGSAELFWTVIVIYKKGRQMKRKIGRGIKNAR